MLDTAEYALFSRREMDRRYARARDLMAEPGIDALVVTGEENFQYFAGTAASIALHHSLTRPSVLVLPLERDPLIITQSKIYVLMSTYISDIVEYFDVLSFPHQVVADVLKQVGLTRNRVGVELGREQRMGIPVGAYLALVDTLPRTSFVDAAELIIKVRMVKSAEELAYIRQAEAGATVDRPEKLVGSRFGHGQGLLITEPPNINPRDHTLLEPGMVLGTEPGIRLGGVYCLWEDVHVITEDGHEQLTLETPELRESPF